MRVRVRVCVCMRVRVRVCVCAYARTCSVASDSLQPHGRTPSGSSEDGISQARILEWGAISYSTGFVPVREKNLKKHTDVHT